MLWGFGFTQLPNKKRALKARFLLRCSFELTQSLHHRITHLSRTHFGRAFAVDVWRAQALGQHRLHCCLNTISRCRLVQAEAQHHGGAEDGGQGVGHAFASDVGGAAVAGFVQALVLLSSKKQKATCR